MQTYGSNSLKIRSSGLQVIVRQFNQLTPTVYRLGGPVEIQRMG
jgi:hypothetical protein